METREIKVRRGCSEKPEQPLCKDNYFLMPSFAMIVR